VGATLSLFSSFGSGATGAYVRFVAEGLMRSGTPLDGVRRQIYLGDRRFLEEMSTRVRSRSSTSEIPVDHRVPAPMEIDAIRELVCREWGVSPEDLRGQEAGDAKLAAVYLCRKLCGKSAREVGEAFGIGRGRVGNIMTELQRRRRTYLQPRLRKLVSELRAGE
jgi:hypothetical protein